VNERVPDRVITSPDRGLFLVRADIYHMSRLRVVGELAFIVFLFVSGREIFRLLFSVRSNMDRLLSKRRPSVAEEVLAQRSTG
jgi:hypothetical protein